MIWFYLLPVNASWPESLGWDPRSNNIVHIGATEILKKKKKNLVQPEKSHFPILLWMEVLCIKILDINSLIIGLLKM